MQYRAIITTLLLTASVFFAACGSTTENNNTNTKPANGNAAPGSNANSTASSEGAPTLGPVFKAYCEAMEKKDETAIKKMYSAETLKSFEEQMKDQKIKTLTEFLKDDMVSSKLCEVKSETIKGNEAIGKIVAEPYPTGIDMVFVKENGEWKLTNRSPVLDMKTGNEPVSGSQDSTSGDKK